MIAGCGALAGWAFSGRTVWIEQFFRVPAALVMLWLACIQVWLSILCALHFGPGERMSSAWRLIALSSGCNLIGVLFGQILGVNSVVNPMTWFPSLWPADIATSFRLGGQILGGPLRFGLLASGLGCALTVYRAARFSGRLNAADWGLLGGFAIYLARNVVDIANAARAGKSFTWLEVANWPTDPLLFVLLIEALRLRRSVQRMGHGWIGHCWTAFSLGVLLTAFGDVGDWANNYGYLKYPWNSVTWFVWLPASTALALAPAYQLEAIHHAWTTESRT